MAVRSHNTKTVFDYRYITLGSSVVMDKLAGMVVLLMRDRQIEW